MTTEKKQIRTDPHTGFPDWGEGHVHGWDWERNCPIPEAERTLTNLLLGALYAYRHGDLATAGKILFTKVDGEYAWETLRDGFARLVVDLGPEPTQEPIEPAQQPAENNVSGTPYQEIGYPLSPYDVRDEVNKKVDELRDRPVKWEMKATEDRYARMAWVWAAGDWRAVEINGKRKARWLDSLPSFVPAHAKGLKPDHSRHERELEVVKEDAKEREAIQVSSELGAQLEADLRRAEAQPKEAGLRRPTTSHAPKAPRRKARPRPTNGLPGADWLLRFDSVDPVPGKARKSKNPLGCELCHASVEPFPDDPEKEWRQLYYKSSKTSGKRGHRRCYEIRRAKLENERINA